jgi:bifunctional ADP-heptose synthase (sugar kinase/adenylyltransferase)
LAAAILSGVDKQNAVKFSNKAAGIVVGHIGTTAITKNELLEG